MPEKVEMKVHPDPHMENGCGGEIEIRVERAHKRITTVCRKCKMGSVIERGKVVRDGVEIEG